MEKHYATDTNNIIYEEIEAELVVINLKSGCYYSLNDSASVVWKLVIEGLSENLINGLLMKHFSSENGRIPDEVSRILSEFIREGLVSEAAEPEITKAIAADEDLAMPDSFQPPVITKHSDVQEMLQLDPIHEVTDLGWPHKK